MLTGGCSESHCYSAPMLTPRFPTVHMTYALPHAVDRLRSARLARSSKPFLARGGPRGERCAGCRLSKFFTFKTFKKLI